MNLIETSIWERRSVDSALGDRIEILVRRSPWGEILEEHITLSKRPEPRINLS